MPMACDVQVVSALAGISGPFSFIYWCHRRQTVYYGRDPTGRRSLVSRKPRYAIVQNGYFTCGVLHMMVRTRVV